MKKRGLILSLIMALFCLGFIHAGVYCASQLTTNTVTGSVEIDTSES